MLKPVQITQVADRAIVRLQSWILLLKPPHRKREEFWFLPTPDSTSPSSVGPGGSPAQPAAPASHVEEIGEGVGLSVPPGLGGQVRLLNIAPGDSYMVSDTLPGMQLWDRFRQHLEGSEIAAVDVSCAVKVLRVQGVAARELLAKGCGLDLHPRFFPAGHVTRTRFAQLPVILDCIDPTPRFDLYVGRSYLAYLHEWLVDSAVEFSA